MGKGSCRVGFDGQAVEIAWNSSAAAALADLLCRDLPLTESGNLSARFDIMAVGNPPRYSLWQDDRRLYHGESRYRVAYRLMNQVIYHCIVDYKKGHAIHAGALSCQGKGVLIAGDSGAGKTTLVASLTGNGCMYLSDELVFLQDNGTLHPFTRPLFFKELPPFLVPLVEKYGHSSLVHEPTGSVIPHRFLNSDCNPITPPLTLILFCRYQQGAETQIQPLSKARGCFRLMKCYVNARNRGDSGPADLASAIGKAEVYNVVYSRFDDLWPRLLDLFPQFSVN